MSEIKQINTFEELKKLSDRILESGTSAIGLDLEGEFNLHRYGIHLCLIQIGFDDEVYLVDPVLIDNLDPLKIIFENKRIEKVIYSCNIDVRLLKYTKDIHLKNIFDVRIAANTLRLETTSLAGLIQEYLGVQIDKDKKCQRSNWNKRPLTEEQISYAGDDVRFLVPLREIQHQMLIEKKVLKQFTGACRKLEKEVFKEKKDKYARVPDFNKLSRQERIFLKYYYEARENAAQQLDYPPFWIMSKEDLVVAAKSPSYTKEEWITKALVAEKAHQVLDLFVAASQKALDDINA